MARPAASAPTPGEHPVSDEPAQGTVSVANESVWQHYLAYLRTAPSFGGPKEMLEGYARALAGEGIDQADIERRIGTLMNLSRVRADAWPLVFDRIYTSGGPNVPETANPLLMAAIEGRPPGRALEVAVGHGRNAVALASRRWDVTGIDVSEVGLAAARTCAERAGVRLTLLREEDRSFDFGTADWDLLAFIYGPVSITDAAYVDRLHRALKPGGLVVVESFASDEQAPQRRPVDIDPRSLLRAFEAFRIVRFVDMDGVSEWDPQPTRLVRLIAQKR
jgi:SAM-dependent methyltransferase